MKKIDLFTFYHDLMGVGFTPNDAQRVVTLLNVRQREAGEKDREKSKRWYARHKIGGGGNGQSALTSSASISSSEVKKNAREVVRKKGRKSSVKIPFPENFQPSESHFAKAAELGCPPAFVLSKFEDMKNWALSNAARKADWSATLHGFIRRDAEKGRQHGQPNYSQTLRSAVSQLKGGAVTALHPGTGGPSPRPALRLISAGESDQS